MIDDALSKLSPGLQRPSLDMWHSQSEQCNSASLAKLTASRQPWTMLQSTVYSMTCIGFIIALYVLGESMLNEHLAKWRYQSYYFDDMWQVVCNLEVATWVFLHKWIFETHRTLGITNSVNNTSLNISPVKRRCILIGFSRLWLEEQLVPPTVSFKSSPN